MHKSIMKTCDHVRSCDKKKTSRKLSCNAGGPEKQTVLFVWPYPFVSAVSKELSPLNRLSV